MSISAPGECATSAAEAAARKALEQWEAERDHLRRRCELAENRLAGCRYRLSLMYEVAEHLLPAFTAGADGWERAAVPPQEYAGWFSVLCRERTAREIDRTARETGQ